MRQLLFRICALFAALDVFLQSAIAENKEDIQEYKSTHLSMLPGLMNELVNEIKDSVETMTTSYVDQLFDALMKASPTRYAGDKQHIDQARDWLKAEFGRHKYHEERKPFYLVETQPVHVRGVESSNVIAEEIVYPGGGVNSECTVVVGAHYDCIPAGGLGADDNGSGVAALLSMASILPKLQATAGKAHEKVGRCKYTFVTFTGEEAGLHGSKAFAGAISTPDMNEPSKVRSVVVLDQLGFIQDEHANEVIFETLLTRGEEEGERLMDFGHDATVITNAILGEEMKIVVNPDAFGSDHMPFLEKESVRGRISPGGASQTMRTTTSELYTNVDVLAPGRGGLAVAPTDGNAFDAMLANAAETFTGMMPDPPIKQFVVARIPATLIISRDNRVAEGLFNHQLSDKPEVVDREYMARVARIAFVASYLHAVDGVRSYKEECNAEAPSERSRWFDDDDQYL